MKNSYVLSLFLFFTITGISAQKQIVYSDVKQIGHHVQSGNEISAREYFFSNRIDNIYLDTVSGYATVQLRGLSKNGQYLNNVGNIVSYDLANRQVRWDNPVNYQNSRFIQYDDVLLQAVGGDSYMIDYQTGLNRKRIKSALIHVDPDLNTGVGYRYSSFSGQPIVWRVLTLQPEKPCGKGILTGTTGGIIIFLWMIRPCLLWRRACIP